MLRKWVLRTIFKFLTKKYPVIASKLLYYKVFKKRLNLNKPTTFNEKLMWLKLYEDDALKTKCTDKYLVRNYVREKGYAEILIDAYQVYESVEEIDFAALPNSFVMKCTHGSGFNIICSNKDELNKEQTITQLKKWMESDYSLICCEPHYSKIKPRVIVEKLLEDEWNGNTLIDYKIHCFHGEPQVIEVVMGRGTTEKKHLMFDRHWNTLPYNEDTIKIKKAANNKPEKFNEMLTISRELSEEFTYVRVDLYFCENKVHFGELTFTPAACLDNVDFNHRADQQLGDLLDLPALNHV